ncbi:hypothetical protein E4U41_003858 [Claviceps citrina]|nr:hypothetical protein E4U41_003858 [Claviceps citrina]
MNVGRILNSNISTTRGQPLKMAWRCSGLTNAQLVENMWRNGLITDERAKDAFLKVDRAHYAPLSSYEDSPQPIGHQATISAPHMHAMAIENVISHLIPSERNPSPRALDIGSGSGYLTHLMAELVGDRGLVVGLEHIAALKHLGESNMRKSSEGRHLLESERVRFRLGDGRLGLEEPARVGEEKYGTGWDVIHVGACAKELHSSLLEQLKAPGCLFIPIEDNEGGVMQSVWRISKDEKGKITKKNICGVRYYHESSTSPWWHRQPQNCPLDRSPHPTAGCRPDTSQIHAAGITADEVTWPELYKSTHRIPGHDVSGTVDTLGPLYDGPLKVGDEVFAMLKAEAADGGQAEYALLSPAEIAPKPSSLSHSQASVLPIPFLTAWEAIFEHAKVRHGSRVLVTGASGAVGLVILQIAARVLSCEVTALASARKHAHLQELGAVALLDYNTDGWESTVRDFDAVFDTVGSETLSRVWKCVKADGTIVTVADPPPSWALGGAASAELQEHPNVKPVYFVVKANGMVLSKFDALMNQGSLRPLPIKSFSSDDACSAWEYAARRGRDGKAVIEFVPPS